MSPRSLNENDYPCEVQVLKSFKDNRCEKYVLEFDDIKFQKLSTNTWLVAIPKSNVIKQTCDKNNKNLLLQGIFIVDLPPRCEVQLNDITQKFTKFKL